MVDGSTSDGDGTSRPRTEGRPTSRTSPKDSKAPLAPASKRTILGGAGVSEARPDTQSAEETRTPSPRGAIDQLTTEEVEPFSSRVVVNPGRDRRLELTLVQGDIRAVDSNCYVVGLFKAVAPDGAASALDRAMGGRISDLVTRRMFGAEVGEVSILPNGRRAMRSSNVAFAGLGSFDSFTTETLELVCENVVRMFVAAGLDEFAMVPFGWGSISNADDKKMSAMVRSMLAGFRRGIEDSDPDYRFRSVTICERDPKRFAILNSEIHDLSQRTSFANVELTIRLVRLPEQAAEQEVSAAPRSIDRIYLMAREAGERDQDAGMRPPLKMSLLTT
jgi:hypothetical protein